MTLRESGTATDSPPGPAAGQRMSTGGPAINQAKPGSPPPAEEDDSFSDVMALAIEGSGTGLWDRNVVTGEIRYSPGWKAILGYRAHELSSRIEEAYTRVHPDDLAYVQAAMQSHFDGQSETYEVEHRLRCKDGSWKWVLSRGKVVARDAAGRALRMVGTTTDITATRGLAERLRKAEEDLQEQREQLFHAQKMEAVGQLTGGLAHDFNNMLMAITGSLELLRADTADGRVDHIDGYVAAALEAATRAAALTHRLLAFSRRQTLDPRSTDANKLIAGMRGLIQRTVGPEIALETRLAPDASPILCDPHQLESAILNLCINARDAMPEGGRIVVETANAVSDEPRGSRHETPPGDCVVITITDTGRGMPPDVLARAFDPFFTTKPSGQGTGLGLSMVYGFARQSDGQVLLHSVSGAGTTVRLYLPRTQEKPGDTETHESSHAPFHVRAGEVALVVDDEPTIRKLIMVALRNVGCRPLEAANGVAALKLLRSDARIDLLITDVRMPDGLNGPELVEQARRVRPTLKVLFITGYADNGPVASGRLGHDMQVLAKPFAIGSLTAKLGGLLGGPAKPGGDRSALGAPTVS